MSAPFNKYKINQPHTPKVRQRTMDGHTAMFLNFFYEYSAITLFYFYS